MDVRERLDVVLVRRGLVRSRSAAQRLITDGAVRVGGAAVVRPSARVDTSAVLTVDDSIHPYVGRGGEKLDYALEVFGFDVAGLRALDVGSSTGGFTECLLEHGAASVVALDVGSGQLAPELRSNARVTVMESTDIRSAEAVALGAPFDIVTCDVSFISLKKVLPAILALGSAAARFVVLVKPQFEVGREHLGRTGVVRDPAIGRQAAYDVAAAATAIGFAVHGLALSVIVGSTGNREYLLGLGRIEPSGCLLAPDGVA